MAAAAQERGPNAAWEDLFKLAGWPVRIRWGAAFGLAVAAGIAQENGNGRKNGMKKQ